MIKKTTRTLPGGNRNVNASRSITANVQTRRTAPKSESAIMASRALAAMSPAQRAFVAQLKNTHRRMMSVTAATNTSNIAARPEFMELLPLFVQKPLPFSHIQCLVFLMDKAPHD